ncbi:hypothetical protein [Salinispora vitiensis]|uniref:hypothetical protein n=1 Tax=Salinispora vitiensis TaxID=999544 RepID=UPI000367F306|nr:hypothetical protein [Salinispora vitiensis]
MAQTSYPLPPDRIITDREYESLMRRSLADGWQTTPGEDVGELPIFYADDTGMHITVRAGKHGLLRGFKWESGDTDSTIAIAANESGQQRVDLVVLRLTRPGYSVALEIRAGVPGSGSPWPVQQRTDPGVYEIPLGRVTVPHGTTSISPSQVVSIAWQVDDVGGVRAYSLYPPRAVVGRTYWEIDTSRLMLCDGFRWLPLHEDTGWVNCTPFVHGPSASGWQTATNGFARARRLNGVVTVQIRLYRYGSDVPHGLSSTCCYLPPSPALSRGFPPRDLMVLASGVNGYEDRPARFEVHTDGSVSVGVNGGIPAGREVAVTVSYPVL